MTHQKMHMGLQNGHVELMHSELAKDAQMVQMCTQSEQFEIHNLCTHHA